MNPLGLQAQLWTAGIAAATCAALLTWGLYWRGEYRETKAVLVALEAQGKILVGAVKDCTAGAERVKDLGDKAVASMDELLGKARTLTAPKWKTVEKIETIIERPAPPGAGCNEAWAEIEALHKKAGATP